MAVTEYFWDPLNDCVAEEYDENGDLIVQYTYEPAPYGPLISETRDGVTYTHHYDALGSTTLLTDDSGNGGNRFRWLRAFCVVCQYDNPHHTREEQTCK